MKVERRVTADSMSGAYAAVVDELSMEFPASEFEVVAIQDCGRAAPTDGSLWSWRVVAEVRFKSTSGDRSLETWVDSRPERGGSP